MRFLADENFPAAAIRALGAAASDVVWIGTAAPGSSDSEVLARAAREGRILLTFDKDFGELAKASTLPAACGVVLLRLPMPAPEKIGGLLADLDDRFHETGIGETGSMELEGCWWIPRLRLAERGAVSWQDGVKRSKWR